MISTEKPKSHLQPMRFPVTPTEFRNIKHLPQAKPSPRTDKSARFEQVPHYVAYTFRHNPAFLSYYIAHGTFSFGLGICWAGWDKMAAAIFKTPDATRKIAYRMVKAGFLFKFNWQWRGRRMHAQVSFDDWKKAEKTLMDFPLALRRTISRQSRDYFLKEMREYFANTPDYQTLYAKTLEDTRTPDIPLPEPEIDPYVHFIGTPCPLHRPTMSSPYITRSTEINTTKNFSTYKPYLLTYTRTRARKGKKEIPKSKWDPGSKDEVSIRDQLKFKGHSPEEIEDMIDFFHKPWFQKRLREDWHKEEEKILFPAGKLSALYRSADFKFPKKKKLPSAAYRDTNKKIAIAFKHANDPKIPWKVAIDELLWGLAQEHRISLEIHPTEFLSLLRKQASKCELIEPPAVENLTKYLPEVPIEEEKCPTDLKEAAKVNRSRANQLREAVSRAKGRIYDSLERGGLHTLVVGDHGIKIRGDYLPFNTDEGDFQERLRHYLRKGDLYKFPWEMNSAAPPQRRQVRAN